MILKTESETCLACLLAFVLGQQVMAREAVYSLESLNNTANPSEVPEDVESLNQNHIFCLVLIFGEMKVLGAKTLILYKVLPVQC